MDEADRSQIPIFSEHHSRRGIPEKPSRPTLVIGSSITFDLNQSLVAPVPRTPTTVSLGSVRRLSVVWHARKDPQYSAGFESPHRPIQPPRDVLLTADDRQADRESGPNA